MRWQPITWNVSMVSICKSRCNQRPLKLYNCWVCQCPFQQEQIFAFQLDKAWVAWMCIFPYVCSFHYMLHLQLGYNTSLQCINSGSCWELQYNSLSDIYCLTFVRQYKKIYAKPHWERLPTSPPLCIVIALQRNISTAKLWLRGCTFIWAAQRSP